jgi:tetratricopeptide (TPR) repeat protein/transcriptional regulator with XRE-family HTH domain
MYGPHLRSWRERHGWSRASLAQALGCAADLIAQWEEGVSVPSSAMQAALHQLFERIDQSLEEVVAVNTPSQDNIFAFLLLPHSTPALPSSDTRLLPGENAGGDGQVQGKETVGTEFTPVQESAPTPLAFSDPFLPPPFTGKDRLVGRDVLLQELEQRILNTRRIALHGLPGVGKTSLAIALAYSDKIRAHFCDGVLWAGLGLHPHLLAEFRRWGTVLGVSLPEATSPGLQDTWGKTLRDALEERRLLLLIDDAWKEDVVKALDIGGSECACILTTRFEHIATNFATENAFLIPELEDAAGVQVLTRFAPELLEREREIVWDLVRAVGGLPLALTLMSKYLGGQAFTHQPRRLRAALADLQNTNQRLRLQVPQGSFGRLPSLSERAEVSIESVIALSYVHLPEPAQKALCALSVFPAKPKLLSRNAVLAVTEAPVETLQVLCNAGLLEQARSGHYLIHPLIVDYARGQAQGTGSAQSTGSAQGTTPTARLITYGVGFIEAHAVDTDALEQESAILIAALQYACEEKRYAELIRGVCLFAPLLLRWGWYKLADKLLQETDAALRYAGGRQDEIVLREQLSILAHAQGDYNQARLYAQQGLTLAYETANEAQAVNMLIRLGIIAQEQGDYTQTETLYQEALLRARAQRMTEQIIVLLKNLGVLAKKRGGYSQAQKYYQEALELASLLEHRDLRSLLLTNLGVVATEQGEYSQALAFYQEGLTLARKAGSREQICLLLSNLGVVADALGNYTQAERYLREGLELARDMGHRERTCLLLLNLGVIVDRQGGNLYAEELYREGLALARKIGHHERISVLLLNLGDVVMEQDRDAEALTYYQEGLELAQKLGNRRYVSDLQLHLGVLATKQGNIGSAEGYLQEGLLLAYQLGHPQLICKGLAAWGELHLHQYRLQAAQQVFTQMLDLVPDGYRVLKAHAQYGLARIAASQGQLQQAKDLAEQSCATFEALGHRKRSIVRQWLESLSQDRTP